MKKMLMLLIIAGGICACNGASKTEGTEVVSYEKNSNNLFTSDWIQQIEITPLETTDESLLGDMPRLLPPGKEGFYIPDYDRQKLYIFNLQGKLAQTIGRIGNGPEEYTQLFDVHTSKNGIELHARISGSPSKFRYTHDGAFVETQAFPLRCRRLIQWRDHEWAYMNYNNQYGPDRLLKLNAAGEKVAGFLPSDAKIIPMGAEAFTRYEDRLFVWEFDNKVYEITENDVVIRYQFDFGTLGIPASYFEYADSEEAINALSQNPFTIIVDFHENDFCAFARFVVHRGQRGGGGYEVLAIKHKKKQAWAWYTIPMEGSLSTLFMSHATLNDEAVIYFLARPESLQNLSPEEKAKFSQPEILDTLKDDDNQVILKFVLAK